MTIFNSPKHIEKPQFTVVNNDYTGALDKLREDEEKFLTELRTFLRKRNGGKYVGKVVKFQVADGYAKYMVASVRPLELVNIPFDDEYQFQYIYNMKWSDIKARIKYEETLEKIYTNQNK